MGDEISEGGGRIIRHQQQDRDLVPATDEPELFAAIGGPSGDPPMPYSSGTELCGALLWPPALIPESFARLDLPDRPIPFYGVFPLHADEMELKLKKGAETLVGLLADANVTELVDPERPSVVAPKRGFFRR